MNIRLKILRKYSTYRSRDFISDTTESRGVYSKSFMSSHYPVNPATGLIDTDTGKLTNINLSEEEKMRVMQRLRGLIGRYSPKGMTDKQLFDLLPPRYFTDDPVLIQLWRDYLGKHIIPYMEDDDKSDKSDNSDNTDNTDTSNKSETTE